MHQSSSLQQSFESVEMQDESELELPDDVGPEIGGKISQWKAQAQFRKTAAREAEAPKLKAWWHFPSDGIFTLAPKDSGLSCFLFTLFVLGSAAGVVCLLVGYVRWWPIALLLVSLCKQQVPTACHKAQISTARRRMPCAHPLLLPSLPPSSPATLTPTCPTPAPAPT